MSVDIRYIQIRINGYYLLFALSCLILFETDIFNELSCVDRIIFIEDMFSVYPYDDKNTIKSLRISLSKFKAYVLTRKCRKIIYQEVIIFVVCVLVHLLNQLVVKLVSKIKMRLVQLFAFVISNKQLVLNLKLILIICQV